MINKLVVENLKHRPLRTLLSIVAISIQVTMVLTLVGVSKSIGRAGAGQALLHESEAILESQVLLGRVEDDVADQLPVLALVLAADDAHGPLKLLAVDP